MTLTAMAAPLPAESRGQNPTEATVTSECNFCRVARVGDHHYDCCSGVEYYSPLTRRIVARVLGF